MTWDLGYQQRGSKKLDDMGLGDFPKSPPNPKSSELSISVHEMGLAGLRGGPADTKLIKLGFQSITCML